MACLHFAIATLGCIYLPSLLPSTTKGFEPNLEGGTVFLCKLPGEPKSSDYFIIDIFQKPLIVHAKFDVHEMARLLGICVVFVSFCIYKGKEYLY